MTTSTQRLVHIRELAAWGLDDYPHRCIRHHATPTLPPDRSPYRPAEIILAEKSAELAHLLLPHSHRADLLEEMAGLHWLLGIIDLRSLLAFQRRLAFDPAVAPIHVPSAHDWAALVELAFGHTKPPVCISRHDAQTGIIELESTNPNLHIRASTNPASPFTLHAGGPFLEVASFRNRWFLRDGYHRAYALLCAGIHAVPALIIHARTLEELGATQPWFFPEEILFSEDPPRVADFLNDALVVEYQRPPLLRKIRITIEETLIPATQPAPSTGDSQ